MDDQEPPYLHGAVSLLQESRDAVETLFERFESAEDVLAKRMIVEAALHELKVRAAIEELVLRDLDEAEGRPRRHVEKLMAELESMTGVERRHDAKFALLAANVRRHVLRSAAAQ